jgi:hypothetical protein
VTLTRLTFWLGAIALLLAGLASYVARHLVNAGPGMQGAGRVLPGLFLGGALVLLCAAGLARLLGRLDEQSCAAAWAAAARLSRQVPHGARPWLVIIAGCLLIVLAFDLPGFVHGFFRLDDFEYLRVVRQENAFRQLLLPHGGHSIPLFRGETYVLATVSGPAPLLFNLANLATCVAVLAAGCWLLTEMGVGWLGLAGFVCLNWFWPGWGEFTAGYYCMLGYLQGLALGIAALAALLHAAATDSKRWLAAAFILAGVALGLSLASTWVLPALVVFAAAVWPTREAAAPRLRPLVIGFTTLTVAFAAWNLVIFRHGGFLGPAVGGPASLAGILGSLLPALGGVMLFTFLPVQAGSLNTGGLVYGLEIAAIGVGAWIAFRLSRRTGRTDRRLLLALGAVLLVQIAMVAVARRPLLTGFYWAAKWTAMAHCTFVLMVAFAADRCVRLAPRGGEPVVKWAAAVFLVGLCAAVATPRLLEAMGAPVSRANNVEGALSRRVDFDRLSASIARLATALDQQPVILPPCSTDRFNRVFPRMEGYSLTQVACALPAGRLRIAPQPFPLPPPTRAAIAGVPDLRRLYLDAAP